MIWFIFFSVPTPGISVHKPRVSISTPDVSRPTDSVDNGEFRGLQARGPCLTTFEVLGRSILCDENIALLLRLHEHTNTNSTQTPHKKCKSLSGEGV